MSDLYTVTVPTAPNEVNRPLVWLGQKAPGDNRQYALNCLPWLNGDMIDTVSVGVAPNGSGDIVATFPGSQDVGKAVVTLTGGNAGTTYAVTFTITTIAGDVLVRTVWLFCQNLSPAPSVPPTVQAVIPAVAPPLTVVNGVVTLDPAAFDAYQLARLNAYPTARPTSGWWNNGGIAQYVYPS
jgi:hypothetical protein